MQLVNGKNAVRRAAHPHLKRQRGDFLPIDCPLSISELPTTRQLCWFRASEYRVVVSYFSAAFQLRRMWIGSAEVSSSRVRMRKRPSRETSYCCLLGAKKLCVRNSA